MFRFPALLLIVCSMTMASHAADKPAAKSPAPAPLAPAPKFLDTVIFLAQSDGENHKMVVTLGAPTLRVDEIDDGFSILYRPATDSYTGLEHRNYTYWEFSWPEVRYAVAGSKRYSTHLQELDLEGSGMSSSPASGAPAASVPVSDDSGYVWRPSKETKEIAGLDCTRWDGQSLSGGNVQAWCYAGALPKVRAAMEKLRAINDPIALVPVRTLVPSQVFPLYDALVRGGVTPFEISWGAGDGKNRFTLLDIKTRDYRADLFLVPRLYNKTTLITMDGIIDQKR